MTRQTFKTPVEVDPSTVEIIDIPKGLRAVVATVGGVVRGKANPVAGKWLVRIDGRLFPPSEDVKRFNQIPGDKITEVPFASFKTKREATQFLRAEVLAGRFFVPPRKR